MIRLPTLALIIPLAACAQPQQPASDAASASPGSGGARATSTAEPPGDDQCGASRIARFVGTAATQAVRDAAAKASGAQTIRRIYPDSMVTEDFSLGRLNVVMDRVTDTIVSARCG